jgi:F-box domain
MSQESQLVEISDFPSELLDQCLDFLPPVYLYLARQVCLNWRELAVRHLRRVGNPYGSFARTLVADGHLELVQSMIGVVFAIDSGLLNLALEFGQLEIVKWVSCHHVSLISESVEAAVKSGDPKILKLIIPIITSSRADVKSIGASGSLALVQEAVSFLMLCPTTIKSIIHGAAREGHIHILEWLWSEFRSFEWLGSMGHAVYKNQFEAAK